MSKKKVKKNKNGQEVLTSKEFVTMISANVGLSGLEMSEHIGRHEQSLGNSLRNDTLTLRDLSKCLYVAKKPLVLVYNKKKYEIEILKNGKNGK